MKKLFLFLALTLACATTIVEAHIEKITMMPCGTLIVTRANQTNYVLEANKVQYIVESESPTGDLTFNRLNNTQVGAGEIPTHVVIPDPEFTTRTLTWDQYVKICVVHGTNKGRRSSPDGL